MKHPVDVHVGKRIRHRRWLVGMTQQQLAESVGIKFQQIQKYETGMNRVSASRLWDIASALSVPVSFFFEGLDDAGASVSTDEAAEVVVQRGGRADGDRLGAVAVVDHADLFEVASFGLGPSV